MVQASGPAALHAMRVDFLLTRRVCYRDLEEEFTIRVRVTL